MLVKKIKIPENVQIFIDNNFFRFTGPNGVIEFSFHLSFTFTIFDGYINIFSNVKFIELAILNTTFVLLKNMIHGVLYGYEKKLKLIGVGYKAVKKDNILVLTLGFSHVIEYLIPKCVLLTVFDSTLIVLKGVDKQKVGQVAAEIREKKLPDSYKGKGIRYLDEVITLKEIGKKK